GNSDIRYRGARHISPRPNSIRAEKHAPRRSSKLYEQSAARRTLTLHEQVHLPGNKEIVHFLCQLLHRAMTGKEDEGASVGFFDKARDPVRKGRAVTGVTWIGHLFHDE